MVGRVWAGEEVSAGIPGTRESRLRARRHLAAGRPWAGAWPLCARGPRLTEWQRPSPGAAVEKATHREEGPEEAPHVSPPSLRPLAWGIPADHSLPCWAGWPGVTRTQGHCVHTMGSFYRGLWPNGETDRQRVRAS